jgi:hypothetical protein
VKRYQAHRTDPCKCDICHVADVRRDILRGIGYGLAAVGAVVAVWVLLVLVFTS